MAVTEQDSFARFPFLALIRRELITQLRMRRIFFALLALSIICAFIVLNQWPFGDEFRWQGLVWRTESLFNTFAMLAMTGGPLIVAAIAAGALVGERERDSWDLLQLSLISRVGIVAGKLLSPFAMFILTLVVCAPIFSALLFLAGLDFVRAAQCLLLVGITTFTCGAIALACSVRARKTVTAVTFAFFVVAVFMGLDVVAVGATLEFLDEIVGISVAYVDYEFIFGASPYFVLGRLLGSGAPIGQLLFVHLVFQAVVLVPAVVYSVWALGRGDVPVSDPEGQGPKLFRRRGKSRSVVRTRSRGPIPDRSNPVFRRELYWGSPLTTVRARRFTIAVFIAAFLVSAALAYTGASTSAWDGRLLMAFIATTLTGMVACLYVPIACANAYTKELAISNFDLLRGTLMRPREIVWGKFKAAVVLCLAVWATCFLANLPVNLWLLSDSRGWSVLVLSYGSLFAALVEGASGGLLASFYSRRGGAAILVSYLIIFMLYFGNFLVVALIADGFNLTENSLVVRGLIAASPVLTYFWLLVEFVDRNDMDRLVDWFASLGIVGLLAVCSQLWMIRRFNARIEKMADH